MASNNNTIVISFSIALFLLLILLLLITYNSKCQMDNVETFLGDPVSNIAREQQEMKNINSVATVAQNDPKFSRKRKFSSKNFRRKFFPANFRRKFAKTSYAKSRNAI